MSWKIIFIVTIIAYSPLGIAYKTCSKFGAKTECGEGVLNKLHVAGKADLDGTTVIGNTHVSGKLDAKYVHLANLKVSGVARLYQAEVSGNTKVSGLLRASDTQFKGLIKVSSNKTHFNHAGTKNIIINPGNDIQYVYLKNYTVINGDIKFISGHGIIMIDRTSKINGHVIGGKIMRV